MHVRRTLLLEYGILSVMLNETHYMTLIDIKRQSPTKQCRKLVSL